MKLERTKNAKRNIVIGTISTMVSMLLPFIVKTILIRKLGAEYLGLNSLFSSILQVLNFSELGFSSAIVYSLYQPIADGDADRICAIMAFYRRIYRAIGLAVLGVGLCLLPFLPHLISGSYPENVNIYLVYVIYLGNTSLSYFMFAYKSALLSAHQRTDVISAVQMLTLSMQYVVQIAVLWFISDYYLYILIMPVFTLANNILNAVWVRRLYPQYVCRGQIDRPMLQDIGKRAGGLIIHKLCGTSRNSFDSIFISAFLGLTATTVYNNYYYIFTAIEKIMSVLRTSMLAGAGNSVAMESAEKNYNDMNKFHFLYMWIAGWCTCCLLCLYQPFMKIWMGEDLMLPFSSVLLFCVYFYTLKMGDIRTVYVDATGLWWSQKGRAIAESAANLILNFTLVQVFGINGIIAATLISLFVINFCWGTRYLFKYYFRNGRMWEYFLYNARYLLVTAAAAAAAYGACSLVRFGGIPGLLLQMLICCIVPNAVYFICHYPTRIYGVSMMWLLRSFRLEEKLRLLVPRRYRGAA